MRPARLTGEIAEFLSAKTLEEIDYGILDLTKIEDVELREVLFFFEDLLTLELKVNYYENPTGIFRVCLEDDGFSYREFGHVIEADCLADLKELVLAENRIWYVFDDLLANRLWTH